MIASNFSSISTFMVRTCDFRHGPSVSYLKSCVYLIYDYELAFEGSEWTCEIEGIVQSREVQTIVE